MEKLRRDHGWEKGLLTALFLLACFQNLTLASIGSGASLKWVHVFSLVSPVGGLHGSENAGMSNERGARNPSAVSLRVPGQG